MNRELDAEVAEKIMGRYVCRDGGGAVCPASSTPNYSGDFISAWEVVERMRESGFDVMLWDGSSGQKDLWLVDFRVPVTDTSLPVAICKAALLAIIGYTDL